MARKYRHHHPKFEFSSGYHSDVYPGDIIAVTDGVTTNYYFITDIEVLVNKSTYWDKSRGHYSFEATYRGEKLIV